MATVLASQVLSGYDQGHGVLAVGGDVGDAERALVDRLSDLSGYLPLDTTFTSYWTGYPCDQRYAFACTWSDTTAVRTGTVLTQTLLVPRGALSDVADLAALATAFKRPTSASDRDAYRVPLTVEVGEGAALPAHPAEDRARAVAALWFGQSHRPLLWMDEADATDVIRALWRLLCQEARETLAFCTFALGVRKIERRPFDFLALPPAARASFLEWTRSPAWFERGKLQDPGVRHFAAERWTGELLEAGAALFEPVMALCREHSIALPPPWMLRDALRFLRLAKGAADPLTAARTRADLLFWLWPNLPPGHSLSRATLGELLALLPAAPVEKRPLRELRDFISRKAVTALAGEDVSFSAQVERTLVDETSRRLRENPAAEAELPELRQACDRDLWRAAVLRGAVASSQEKAAFAADLLVLSAHTENPAWTRDALEPLPAAERTSVVPSASEALESARVRWLWTTVAQVASSLSDVPLLLAALSALGDHEAPIGGAVKLALESGIDFATLMRSVPPEALLRWALVTRKDESSAARIGEEAARALQLDLGTLAARCTDAIETVGAETSVPARVFAHVASAATTGTIETSLRGQGLLAEHLVRLAIREGRPAASLLQQTLAALPEDALVMDGTLTELERPARSAWARDVVESLTPGVIELLHKKTVPPMFVARWVTLSEARSYLSRSTEWDVFARCPRWARGALLPSLVDAAQQSVNTRPTPPWEWITKLLLPALEPATAEQVAEASSGIVALLDCPVDAETRFSIAAAALDAVRWKRARGGRAIVERAFPIVYPEMVREGARELPWYLRAWLAIDSWDRAKPLRRWLLDTWIAWGWPPVGFLRALGGDRVLFRRMVARMARTAEGLQFLRSIGEAVASDPDVAAMWSVDVQRALANPHAPVDYE